MASDDERWPFEADGAPEYRPIERVDTLVECARCGAVVSGDVGGQSRHRIWHDNIDRRIERTRTALPQVYG